jgi:hypothetical protein
VPASEKKLNYIKEYNKKNYKQLKAYIKLDDTEVLEKLESVPSVQAYILDLIKQDIRKAG